MALNTGFDSVDLYQIILTITLICALSRAWFLITSPLNHIPGPPVVRLTHLWRLWRAHRGNAEQVQYELHQKHGIAVRLGPNCVSINDPTAIRVIYGRKNLWRKSDLYAVNDLWVNRTRVPNVFSARDEEWNAKIMKPVIRLFSMSNMLALEPRIDATINYFVQRLEERFAETGKPCPTDEWMHYFAWDVIGEVTFARRMGFLEKGEDIGGQIKGVEGSMEYFATIGQMPFLDHFLNKNPIYHIGPEVFGPSIAMSLESVEARRKGTDGHDQAEGKDLLDMYLEAQEKHPDIVDEQTLLAYMIINIAAGSDTVATELRSVLYRLCRHPEDMERLQRELDEAARSDQGLKVPISWTDCQTRLPFLDACVREGIRLQPGISLPLERIVPKEGFTLSDGRFIPAGTVVGINPYVINRHEGVFGPEADKFRPQRWLRTDNETEAEFEARTSFMRENEFTFGFGKRQCSGKSLAWLEVYKLIGTLLLKFDVQLADPSKEWKTANHWFVRQWDMDMIFRKRTQNLDKT